jgi:hypothetical protein
MAIRWSAPGSHDDVRAHAVIERQLLGTNLFDVDLTPRSPGDYAVAVKNQRLIKWRVLLEPHWRGWLYPFLMPLQEFNQVDHVSFSCKATAYPSKCYPKERVRLAHRSAALGARCIIQESGDTRIESGRSHVEMRPL